MQLLYQPQFVECPARTVHHLAPEKDHRTIKLSMARIRAKTEEQQAACRAARRITNARPRAAPVPRFAPAGQSTQMIVGAEASTDDRSITFWRSGAGSGCAWRIWSR